ncbi:MAG: DUF5050 domain-containing protein [Caldisericia bacterium]|nr:DUF5050 domain-containing protein [Caldisericia bacterium]
MKKLKLFSTIVLLSLFFISSALIGCNSSSSSIDYGNVNGNISNGGCMVGNKEYVFFINPKKNHGITRMKQDGTGIVQISPNDCHWMNLYENKIYYIQDNDQCIYRMNLDGSSCNIVSITKAYHMIVAHNTIYFLNPEDDNSIYSMNLDGKKETKLTENEAEGLNVVQDQIYYISPQITTTFTKWI